MLIGRPAGHKTGAAWSGGLECAPLTCFSHLALLEAEQWEGFSPLEVVSSIIKESRLELLYTLVYGSLILGQEGLQHAVVQVHGSLSLWVPKVQDEEDLCFIVHWHPADT